MGEVGVGEEGQEAAGRLLLAAQGLRNLLPPTVVEAAKHLPFPQVNCLQDVHLVEALELRFMETGVLSFAKMPLFIAHFLFSFSGSMGVVTQESLEEAWLGVDFPSYSGPWLGEALLVLGQWHICTTQRLVTLLFSPLRA